MSRIVINALSARLGGGQTYIINFLSRVNSEHEFIVLVGPYNRTPFEKAAAGKKNIRFYDCGSRQANPLYRIFWERFVLSRLLRSWQADVYYSAGGGTFTAVPKEIVSATIIRNMLPFDLRERKRFPLFSLARLKLRLLRSIAIYAVKRSDKVVFISQYSQKIVSNLIPDVCKKSRVIPHGIDARFLSPPSSDFEFARFGLVSGQFYLYVSIFNHYKAQKEVVEEWERLVRKGFSYPLVLTGSLQTGYAHQVKDLICKKGLQKNVIITGPVPYTELPGFYAGARGLLFASSCECCPNILLEKMAAEKPLFSSNFPPMPEIGGPSPYYFNPYSPGELASAIMEAENFPEEAARRAEQNLQRAKMFTWEKTVRETLDFLLEKSLR